MVMCPYLGPPRHQTKRPQRFPAPGVHTAAADRGACRAKRCFCWQPVALLGGRRQVSYRPIHANLSPPSGVSELGSQQL